MGTAFLSYCQHDAPALQALASDVEALGYSVWFDGELTGGQRWWCQIRRRTRARRVASRA